MAGRSYRTVSVVLPLTKNAKTDVVEKEYIGWAIKNGFEVIDVNVPKVEITEVRPLPAPFHRGR